MKTVEITEASLTEYGRKTAKETWVLINRSWTGYKAAGGISLEELKRKYGLKRTSRLGAAAPCGRDVISLGQCSSPLAPAPAPWPPLSRSWC
jgi:hypothetical protein